MKKKQEECDCAFTKKLVLLAASTTLLFFIGQLCLVLYILNNINSILCFFSALSIILFITLGIFWWRLCIAYRSNISSHKEAESQLEEQRARLLHESQLANLGKMAGGIAHEINNPLAIIDGYTMRLLRMSKKSELTREILETTLTNIQQTVSRIARIIRSLRALSRNAAQDPIVSIPIKQIIEETLDLCVQRLNDDGVALQFETPTADLTIECRPVQISQVLVNLINNAHYAASLGEKKWIRITVVDRNNNVEISIEDSGPGVPNDIRSKIMHPFFTTKEAGKGTGLGLSISKQITDEHGGRLYLDDQAEHTRFVVTLPKKTQISNKKPG